MKLEREEGMVFHKFFLWMSADLTFNFRTRVPRRTRKYSEAISGSVGLSLATSVSKVYPQFMGPGMANSYR